MNDTNNESHRQEQSASVAAVHHVPPPQWIDEQPYSLASSVQADAYTDGGLCRILFDSQVNLNTSGSANYCRSVQRIVTRTGAEKAAQFAVEFDPSSQRIDLHFIRVIRGEEQIDHANTASLQLLRRETKLERLALDGRLTATLLIPDLRIGDVIEASFTVYSNSPILEGKYAAWLVFNAIAPWMEVRHRLLRPATREIFQKTFNAPPDSVVATKDDIVETKWRFTNQPRLEAEDFTPSWIVQVPAVQFTEFSNWREVAHLFLPYYACTELPVELSLEVDRLASSFTEPADRAAEWLRFVQRQLRYFALALGEGGLVPREIDAIWASRFGDCKDATRLFLAGAAKLGLDACASLTSTTHGLGLAEFLPSPSVFNHCIVRLRLDGKTYWLDPTMPRQQGRLDVIYQPHGGWALPLALPLSEDAHDLERQNNDEPLYCRHSEQEFRFGSKPDSPVSLKLTIEHYSMVADFVRHRLENEGVTKYSEQMLNQMRGVWSNILETAPVQWQDNPADNRLTAIFSYEIRDAWKPQAKPGRLGFAVSSGSIAAELAPLKKTQRRNEVFLGRPRKLTWRVRMHMPRRWAGAGWNQVLNAWSVRYTNKLFIEAREVLLYKEMLIQGWSLPASHADEYQALVAKAHENLTTIAARVTLGRIHSAVGGFFALSRNWRLVLWFLFMFMYLAWMIIQDAHVQR
jgi:hypothetical protein